MSYLCWPLPAAFSCPAGIDCDVMNSSHRRSGRHVHMGYSIECAESFSSDNASESDIHRAFDDDGIRGEYIILTAPDGSYLQAAGEGDGPYTLEYRNAGESANYRADHEPTKRQVRE